MELAQPRGPESLTATERGSPRSPVAAGRNQQIAQAQFVSVRTVGPHLAHIYGKLNIGSQSELSAALASAGAG